VAHVQSREDRKPRNLHVQHLSRDQRRDYRPSTARRKMTIPGKAWRWREEDCMHLVPAPAVRLMKRRVLSRPGVNSLMSSPAWSIIWAHSSSFVFHREPPLIDWPKTSRQLSYDGPGIASSQRRTVFLLGAAARSAWRWGIEARDLQSDTCAGHSWDLYSVSANKLSSQWSVFSGELQTNLVTGPARRT
jgi:hypothetical protein